MKKTYKLTPQQHKRITEYRNSVSPDVPLPIFVFNFTKQRVRLNIKYDRTKYDYGHRDVSYDNWIATLQYEESNEPLITHLLLLI